jgi:hypothetical protein
LFEHWEIEIYLDFGIWCLGFAMVAPIDIQLFYTEDGEKG